MKKVNLRDLRRREHRSPAGKFAASHQDISVALGREAGSTDLQKRHPFDVALVHIPPGATRCPYHSHSAETEFYLVVSGTGEVRDENETRHEVRAGDAFLFQPGEAHQLSNPGKEDLVYYVIADNPQGDTCYYPDSGKWSVWNGTEEQIIQGEAADYYAGEESLG